MSAENKPLLIINPSDDVGVARVPLAKGQSFKLNGAQLTVPVDVPAGHKVGLVPLEKGSLVHKYGEPIGRATADIGAGEWIHTHNLQADISDERGYEFATATPIAEYVSAEDAGTFEGFLRENGDVGTRNYVVVIATSNCSSHVATEIAEGFRDMVHTGDGCDGVVAIPHQEGCGMSEGDDTWQLERTIAGIIFHPNVGGVLMVSLGCEVNQIEELQWLPARACLACAAPPSLATRPKSDCRRSCAGRRSVQGRGRVVEAARTTPAARPLDFPAEAHADVRSEREPASEAGGRVGVGPGLLRRPPSSESHGGAHSSSRLAPTTSTQSSQ